MKVYTAWSEWDLGLEGRVFASRKAAEDAIRSGITDSDLVETYAECIDYALVGIEWIELEGEESV